MKKKLAVILFLINVIFIIISGPAFGLSYYGFEEHGGTWYDVNKTWQNDSALCWAATASNMLAWSGWGYPTTETFNDENDIYNYFKAHWPNSSNTTVDTLSWWFDGVDASFWANPTTIGGAFWPSYNIDDYIRELSNYQGDIFDKYVSLFSNGYAAIGMRIRAINQPGHIVTAWGYEYDENGNYIGIYLTDSDDHYEGMVYYNVSYSDSLWYIDDYYYSNYGNYYMCSVLGLASNPENLNPVPEPTTMLLFGTGLAGFIGTRIKRKKK